MSTKGSCDPLIRAVRSTDDGGGGGGGRFLCFARVDDGDGGGLAVCATDGVGLWRERIEDARRFVTGYLPPPPPPPPPTHRASVPLSTTGDALLTRFKTVFMKGDMTISESQDKLHLNLSGQELSTIDLELPEATEADTKKELPAILFHLADKNIEIENGLKLAEKKIENLEKRAKSNNAAKSVFDMTSDIKRRKTTQKAPPKTHGMSVINPGNKRRTAPKGVQFD